MTKIGVVSDLHSEFWDHRHQQPGGIVSQVTAALADAEIVLLAGDIGNGVDAIAVAIEMFPDKPVFIVAGNHEYYGNDYQTTLDAMRQAAAGTNVSFLQQDEHRLTIGDQDIRILGTTLWTDFALLGNSALGMLYAKQLNCFRMIQHDLRKLLPRDTLAWHNEELEWLMSMIDQPFEGKTIVMTHHAPVSFAISDRYKCDSSSPCFASRLEHRLTRDDVALVVWGHTHHCVDVIFDNTRFVSCQTGYARSGQQAENGNYGMIIDL